MSKQAGSKGLDAGGKRSNLQQGSEGWLCRLVDEQIDDIL